VLEILPSPEAVVALRVSALVDEIDIERSIQAIENALAHRDRIALYVEVAGIAPGALTRRLGDGLGKLRDLHRFPKIAVVTSQEWVRWVVHAQGRIIPQIEFRTFTQEERDEALAWASRPVELAQEDSAPAPASVHMIATTKPNVIAFEVNGQIRSADMRRLISSTREALDAHERLRVLVRVVSFDGVSLDALREEGLVSIKMRGWDQVDRYALIGGPSWMQMVASWVAPFVRAEIRHFEIAREDEAWRWVETEPRSESPK